MDRREFIVISLMLMGAASCRRTSSGPSPSPEFPDDISGLIIHLDASAIVGMSDGDPLPTWPDSGPNSYDLTQGDSANQPVYRGASFNGKPCVEFDGSNDNMRSLFGRYYSQPNTIFAVVEFDTVPPNDAYPWLDGVDNSNRHWMGSDTANQFSIWAGSSFLSSGISESTNPILVRGIYNGGSSSITIGGGDPTSGVNIGTQGLAGITVGSRWDNMRHVSVRIAEIAVWAGTLSDIDIQRVEYYLRAKYLLGYIHRFGSFPTTGKWAYGALADNGYIYGTPFQTSAVLKLNPSNNSATTFPGPGSSNNQWIGLIKAQNGKLYGVPARNPNVLVIDPADDSTTTFVAADFNEFYGGALADNGIIYCCPFSRDTVLKIDPSTDTSTTIGPVAVTTSSSDGRWGWFVKDPASGRLYGAPRDEPSVLVVDPSTDSISYITTGVPAGSRKYTSGLVASNGEIWLIPRNATTFLVIDPSTDTVRTVGGLPAGTDKWNGGMVRGDWIVMFPRNFNKVVAVNSVTEEIRYYEVGLTAQNKWVGSVTAGDEAFLIPYFSPTIGLFDPKSVGL